MSEDYSWVKSRTKPTPGPQNLHLDPLTTALLIIDMQKDFVGKNGAFAKFNEGYVELPRRAIPAIKDAIEFAHQKNMAVIYTKQIHVPEAFAAGLHNALGREMSALREAKVQFCMKDSEGAEIIEELAPEKRDYIIEKNKASAFYNTWLDIWLRYRKVRTLLIAGCSTGYCVAHSIMDAWARDFDTIALRDCIGDAFPFVQENLLALFDMRWGRVMDWKDVKNSIS